MTIADDVADDLVVLLEVADRPVRVEEAAAALGAEDRAVLEAAERLMERGLATEREGGLVASGDPPRVSASRRSLVAARWAEALARAAADPAEIGFAQAEAGRHAEAAAILVPLALEGAPFRVVDRALESATRAKALDPSTEGRLRLARAIHRRNRGESAGAVEDIEVAVRRLDGEPLVDALGFAAALADDLQLPQRSETYTALAELAAAGGGHLAKLGSLLTLQGRSLNRIGFPHEADRALEVGNEIVARHGSARQRHNARTNQAWVWLDRGDARRAEPAFSALRDEARDMDEVWLANQEAYWARALFSSGDPARAAEALARAERAAGDAAAPRFIAFLARTEGDWLFGRHLDGLEAADAALDLAQAAMPAWENVARYWRAANLAGLDRVEDAVSEAAAALAATPAGPDGSRWRARLDALLLDLRGDRDEWPQREAEDLTDHLLQSTWYDAACLLLAARSQHEQDPELGAQAAALALRLGNPMLASRAAERGGLWSGPVGYSVARAMRPVLDRLPPEWAEDCRTYPPVAHALAVDLSADVADEDVERRIDDALVAAGLAGGDVVLSPAQRRERGMVPRRAGRTRRALGGLALAAGIAVLSAVTALGVTALGRQDEPAATTAPTTAPTTTAPLAMEETTVEVPEGGIQGQAPFRGGNTRSGQSAVEVGEPVGRYWVQEPGGFFGTDPVVYGRVLYLGSATADSLMALHTADGSLLFEVATDDRVESAPAIGQVAETTYAVFGADDGVVYARDALRGGLSTIWEHVVGGQVRGSPVLVGASAIVATTEGRLLSLALQDNGREEWVYTGTESQPLGRVEGSPAEADGVVYVADRQGFLHLVDSASGEPLCEPFEAFGPIVGNPVVADGAVYLATSVGTVHALPQGSCLGTPQGKVGQIQHGVAFSVPPAAAGDVLFAQEEQRLLAYDTADGQLSVWRIPYDAADRIVTSPVVAQDVVVVGTQRGVVIGVDRETGEERWRFEAGSPIAGSPAVVPGAVFVTTENGAVIAIATEVG